MSDPIRSQAGPSRFSSPPPTSTRSGRSHLPFLFLAIALQTMSVAAVTVYTGSASSTITSLAPGATFSGYGAYDPTTLTPPAPPNPAITGASIAVPASPETAQASNYNISQTQSGNFLGFSIELSVSDVVLGKSGTQLKPEFLNYMANIQARAGQGPIIRVGGNTQEGSTIFADGLADGLELDKILTANGTYGTKTVSRNYITSHPSSPKLPVSPRPLSPSFLFLFQAIRDSDLVRCSSRVRWSTTPRYCSTLCRTSPPLLVRLGSSDYLSMRPLLRIRLGTSLSLLSMRRRSWGVIYEDWL